jgi:4-aminobutyrate aminotransferase/(S)-3-amino-2-methylpropionate transaminase
MDAPLPGGVGGTYVGNPVAIAAALAVLDVIDEEGLVERSAAIGESMRSRLESWQARWPQIGDVRGLGGMLAVELVQDEDKVPATELASRVVAEAMARGLLLLKAGVAGNCIRVLVPLVVSDGELEEALDVWEAALEAAL